MVLCIFIWKTILAKEHVKLPTDHGKETIRQQALHRRMCERNALFGQAVEPPPTSRPRHPRPTSPITIVSTFKRNPLSKPVHRLFLSQHCSRLDCLEFHLVRPVAVSEGEGRVEVAEEVGGFLDGGQ